MVYKPYHIIFVLLFIGIKNYNNFYKILTVQQLLKSGANKKRKRLPQREEWKTKLLIYEIGLGRYVHLHEQ
jgi:hypothetical protein